jgi:hypothetical protein
LKQKLLRLLQAGAAGVVLASATLDTPVASAAPSPAPKSRQLLEERIDHLRKQLPAEPGSDVSSADAENLLAWYNWHNWHNWW